MTRFAASLYRITSPLGQATMVGAPELARQVLVDRYARYQQKSRAYAVLRILMGNGLVTSEGEFWRGQRKLVQPGFSVEPDPLITLRPRGGMMMTLGARQPLSRSLQNTVPSGNFASS